jgi:hypothetical protein
MEISPEAVALIVAWEVGGGDRQAARAQYDALYTHPHWPGNSASGLTIGIGYDLRFARAWFEDDWKTRLNALQPADTYQRLAFYVGKRGDRAAVLRTRDIAIPWDDAMAVYRVRVLPRFIEEARRVFPGADRMHAHVWGALTSLIYNCGAGTKNKPEKRRAYDLIRRATAANDLPGVAAGIQEMKKHHARSPKVARGLGKRRDDEAALVMRVASRTGHVPTSDKSVA